MAILRLEIKVKENIIGLCDEKQVKGKKQK